MEFRLFSEIPKDYYQIKQSEIDYSKILRNSIEFGGVGSDVRLDQFQLACEKLKGKIEANHDFKELFSKSLDRGFTMGLVAKNSCEV
jgi:hypothetical protein